jgi:hypothetical protein
MCDLSVKMQKEVKVYSFRLESSRVQQESVVAGRVKCHTARRSTEEDMRLQVLQIPHTYNLKKAGAEDTRVNVSHSIRLENFKLALLGVSEVRWNGVGSITTTNGNLFIYSGMPGENESHIRGVGILIHKIIKDALLDLKPVSE